MTTTPDKPETEQVIGTFSMSEIGQEFNWRNCWYPVTFVQDLPKNDLYSFSLYAEPLVLYRNQDGKLGCLADCCPHRAAKLSDGQIIDGRIECLYHGWQFGVDGQCLHIPQLPQDAKIPTHACVKSFKVVERQGIVWMWAGNPETADEKLILTIPELDNPAFVSIDIMTDRPYDQGFCIENLLDPAHFPISHHGSDSDRKNAQPLEFEVLQTSIAGFTGRYRNAGKPNENWIDLDFFAPNLIQYRLYNIGKLGNQAGLASYPLPLSQGRCRVLSRFYRNFSTWKIKLQPRWWTHFYRSRVLEEDMYFLSGAQAEVERLGQSLKKLYLPLKTSDTLVLEYRKWLDKYGSSLPFYRGYATSKLNVSSENEASTPSSLDRFERHTKICGSCHQAYQGTKLVQQTLIGVAIALTALAILTDDLVSHITAFTAVLAVSLAAVTEKMKIKFERPYQRP
ncbi:MAG: Rieske 2Fe-2S domain-containing protein [Stigonema ocellatum SAG 48.90 = DSM 106950]|nr:Rieske 2Fe-2S domain-containing protein [Stigonema ocellatum SAG 48.90 = DSM 106950]